MAWRIIALILVVFVFSSSAVCPTFWTQWRDNCYMYTGTPAMNWKNAEAYCEMNGAHLTSIHSEDEHKFILDLWRKFRDHNTWFENVFWRAMNKKSRMPFVYIGLNDMEENGVFKWTDGTPYDYGQDNWLPRNPETSNTDLGLREDGVFIWDRQGNLGKWNDVNSRSRFLTGPSICKKPA